MIKEALDSNGNNMTAPAAVRSALFVPAIRRAWVEKAWSYGADAIVLDLEDATPPSRKEEARVIVRELVPVLQERGQHVWVRVNSLGEDDIRSDLDVACRQGVEAIVMPKVEGAQYLEEADRLISYYEGRNGVLFRSVSIVPLLETATALYSPELAFRGSSRVRYAGAIASPGADVEFAVGYRWTSDFLESLYFRSQALLAARASGIWNPITGLVTRLDQSLVRRFAEHSRDLGYEGMFVIHPDHVGIANDVFSPSEQEYQWSREVLDEYASQVLAGGNAAVLDSKGSMIDLATLRTAERIADRYQYFTEKNAAGKS
jgi:citrate lyase subunit beta/citryl-CoA lyase